MAIITEAPTIADLRAQLLQASASSQYLFDGPVQVEACRVRGQGREQLGPGVRVHEAWGPSLGSD